MQPQPHPPGAITDSTRPRTVHGGNAVLTNSVQQANRSGAAITLGLYPSREDWDHARTAAALVSTMHDDIHASELEASILLAAYPDYLRDGWASAEHAATDLRYLTTVGMRAYTSSGVIYPSYATADKATASSMTWGRPRNPSSTS
ncbi:creatininase family protein [Mycolicibacterium aubagnense]|uniref:Uncharacterized protein n=1 Tax=Mycolicibacterium aubagnense TaxID=319707 RepID=A0ABN5Z4Q1_9MYCO|nr:creatininase family protein [Mycolicibacterium aubagnense]BBX88049.1 hypothetical protein MAUB_62500 [Mycolicibacterium aubagnense]